MPAKGEANRRVLLWRLSQSLMLGVIYVISLTLDKESAGRVFFYMAVSQLAANGDLGFSTRVIQHFRFIRESAAEHQAASMNRFGWELTKIVLAISAFTAAIAIGITLFALGAESVDLLFVGLLFLATIATWILLAAEGENGTRAVIDARLYSNLLSVVFIVVLYFSNRPHEVIYALCLPLVLPAGYFSRQVFALFFGDKGRSPARPARSGASALFPYLPGMTLQSLCWFISFSAVGIVATREFGLSQAAEIGLTFGLLNQVYSMSAFFFRARLTSFIDAVRANDYPGVSLILRESTAITTAIFAIGVLLIIAAVVLDEYVLRFGISGRLLAIPMLCFLGFAWYARTLVDIASFVARALGDEPFTLVAVLHALLVCLFFLAWQVLGYGFGLAVYGLLFGPVLFILHGAIALRRLQRWRR